MGSRRGSAPLQGGTAHHDPLGRREARLVAERDSLYTANVGETGWPYVQNRGGPKGFLRVLDETTTGFADFSGNLQYLKSPTFYSGCQSEYAHIACVLPFGDEFRQRIAF